MRNSSERPNNRVQTKVRKQTCRPPCQTKIARSVLIRSRPRPSDVEINVPLHRETAGNQATPILNNPLDFRNSGLDWINADTILSQILSSSSSHLLCPINGRGANCQDYQTHILENAFPTTVTITLIIALDCSYLHRKHR